jgi:hypothetical protein
MAKALADIRSLARAHTETAIKTLAGIMQQPDAPAAARVSAAQALLDRGWGKPKETVELIDNRDVAVWSKAEILACLAERGVTPAPAITDQRRGNGADPVH